MQEDKSIRQYADESPKNDEEEVGWILPEQPYYARTQGQINDSPAENRGEFSPGDSFFDINLFDIFPVGQAVEQEMEQNGDNENNPEVLDPGANRRADEHMGH